MILFILSKGKTLFKILDLFVNNWKQIKYHRIRGNIRLDESGILEVLSVIVSANFLTYQMILFACY